MTCSFRRQYTLKVNGTKLTELAGDQRRLVVTWTTGGPKRWSIAENLGLSIRRNVPEAVRKQLFDMNRRGISCEDISDSEVYMYIAMIIVYMLNHIHISHMCIHIIYVCMYMDLKPTNCICTYLSDSKWIYGGVLKLGTARPKGSILKWSSFG